MTKSGTKSGADVIRYIYDCTNRWDLEGLAAVTHPDIEWFSPGSLPWKAPGSEKARGSYDNYHKATGAAGYLQAMFREYLDEDAHFEVETVIAAQDEGIFAAKGLLIARDQRTGENFNMRFCHWWKIVDGKSLEMEIYADTALLAAAVPAGGWQKAAS
jgi:ketosteroid isomerase-like protein